MKTKKVQYEVTPYQTGLNAIPPKSVLRITQHDTDYDYYVDGFAEVRFLHRVDLMTSEFLSIKQPAKGDRVAINSPENTDVETGFTYDEALKFVSAEASDYDHQLLSNFDLMVALDPSCIRILTLLEYGLEVNK